MGGKIGKTSSFNTAFYYRQAIGIIEVQNIWKEAKHNAENIRWIEERISDLYPITFGSYINFPSSMIYESDKEYYGLNICRLRKVKHDYDPYNVFNFQQSIKGLEEKKDSFRSNSIS